MHGLITSSGNQLYLNLFQHHSPTLIAHVWKQILHRRSSPPPGPPPPCPPSHPSSTSKWSLFFFSFCLVLSRFSLTNHHFRSFQHCSLQHLCLWSSTSHPCTLVFRSVPALLTSLVPAPNAIRSSLIRCFAIALFYLLSSSLLTFRTEYLGASWVHPTSCLPFSCTARTLISKCVLRKEGLPLSWEQSFLTTGTAYHPVPLDHALPSSFSCSYASSSFWQCNNTVRWGKIYGRLTFASGPVDMTGAGIHLNKLSLRQWDSSVSPCLVGWPWPASRCLSSTLSLPFLERTGGEK